MMIYHVIHRHSYFNNSIPVHQSLLDGVPLEMELLPVGLVDWIRTAN